MKLTALLLSLLILGVSTSALVAHGGGLDGQGGHHDRKNGGYHVHGVPSYSHLDSGSNFEESAEVKDSFQSDARTEPRTKARTGARVNSRESARSTARVSARRPEPAPKRAAISWSFIDASEIEQSSLTEAPEANLVFFEMSRTKVGEIENIELVVADPANESLLLYNRTPSDAEILAAVKRYEISRGSIRIFMNGMSRTAASWTHAKFEDGIKGIWRRSFETDELVRGTVLSFSHELRDWQSANGKFKIRARLMSRKQDEVILLAEDGRRVTVQISKLCQNDQEYLASVLR